MKQKYNFLPKFPLTDKKISQPPQFIYCRKRLLAASGMRYPISGIGYSGIGHHASIGVPAWVSVRGDRVALAWCAVGSIQAMEKVPAIRCPHPYPLECTPGHINVDNSTNLLDCPHLAPSERSGSGGTVDNELQEHTYLKHASRIYPSHIMGTSYMMILSPHKYTQPRIVCISALYTTFL